MHKIPTLKRGLKKKPTDKRAEEDDRDHQDSVQNVENFTGMSIEDLDLNKNQFCH